MKQLTAPNVGVVDDKTMLAMLTMWRAHTDTLTIARQLHLPESFVYNRLAQIREATR